MKFKDGIPFNPYGLFHGIFIPNGIKNSNKRLTATAKLLMGQLLHYSGKDGKAFPSRKRLCQDLEISLSSLDRAIKLLKDEKLIETIQKDERSPSIYIFLTNSSYYDEDQRPSGGTVKNDSGGTVKNDSGGTVKNDKHKEINKERDQKRKRNNFSSKNSKLKKMNGSKLKTKGVPDGTQLPSATNGSKRLNGKKNSCKKVKVKVHKNKTLAKKKLLNLPKLKKIQIKPNPLTKFNFEPEVFEILNHWKNLGGKFPKDPNRRKVADQIEIQIQELLIKGNNPYTSVLTDKELEQFRTKKWTVQEIKDTITHFKKELCKPIEDMTFLQFIVHKNYKANKTLRDYSPLVTTYSLLPQKLSFIAKRLKEDFTTDYPDIPIYDTTFINIANFLEEQLDIYKPHQPYSNLYFEPRFVNEIFSMYMYKKLNPKGTFDELRYMANPQNLNEFIQWCKTLHLIQYRTKEEKQTYKKELIKGYKNQINAYQKMIDRGDEDNINEEGWNYLEYIKTQVEEFSIC